MRDTQCRILRTAPGFCPTEPDMAGSWQFPSHWNRCWKHCAKRIKRRSPTTMSTLTPVESWRVLTWPMAHMKSSTRRDFLRPRSEGLAYPAGAAFRSGRHTPPPICILRVYVQQTINPLMVNGVHLSLLLLRDPGGGIHGPPVRRSSVP